MVHPTRILRALHPLVLLAAVAGATAVHAQAPRAAAADSAEVAAAVDRFHRAILDGKPYDAGRMLTNDVVILQGGGPRPSYRSHAWRAEFEHARPLLRRLGPVEVRVQGDVAWSTAIAGPRDDRHGSRGAELLVLTRTPEGWKIDAVHWSSPHPGRR